MPIMHTASAVMDVNQSTNDYAQPGQVTADGGLVLYHQPTVLVDGIERARWVAISDRDFPLPGAWALVWGRTAHPAPVWVNVNRLSWPS